ncbi:short-chain dehydrogenase [Actinoplanes lobatus]|uniref:NAD(P)-dependent dehydrogenase (Short-subunit alcohol dehydrogenase family) n=1 Tax=Actinoplanes lobatus TaxID=113568 RepID=A0A7W7MEQ7_9ACTN|nr:SDR family NAD(P)-dependent oxidoreductase [Actinoplanes lobatus]MBB4747453.1 NAD(P)-dependent dehydrogenase (short-subunit alcohol dehydrogenase family) [Actinoplanes lobatus]GGN78654.1 short-chain dehydrogenase [Actinoplanes lobatus]GIE45544.1 short-chain dehydrogenase [Actinoplanes lobatus]
MGALSGKHAMVTGAGSGIGRAVARTFADARAAVTVVDIDAGAAEQVCRRIVDAGGTATAVVADVSEPGGCDRAVAAAVERHGGIDVLCNAAGIIRRGSVTEISEDDWTRVMAVNVDSVFLLGRRVVPLMEAAGGGSIVSIASGWGLKGGDRAAVYCASKAAVVNLTRAMAIDHGPRGIRVNCVCPGDTDTPMLRQEAAQLGAETTAFLAEAAERPLARIGRPEEIAAAVLFLAADTGSFVTGVALPVDGGGIA